jgi:SAM-dependent methyltransferase
MLLQAHNPDTKSILEMGCGTGAHAELLARQGYKVHGIDSSEEMLKRAEKRLERIPNELNTQLEFSKGDIRTIRLGRQFDVVLSLFHVMSYQTENEDFLSAILTAKAHLKPNGIFIFDCWYGPAVLSEGPSSRLKRLSDDKIDVVRFAEPVMHPNENIVDVNYQVFITQKVDKSVSELQEIHKMRYLFRPEIEFFISNTGFQVSTHKEWMSNRQPSCDTWNTYFVLKLS